MCRRTASGIHFFVTASVGARGHSGILAARVILRDAANHLAKVGETFILDLLRVDGDRRRCRNPAADARAGNRYLLQILGGRLFLRFAPWCASLRLPGGWRWIRHRRRSEAPT